MAVAQDRMTDIGALVPARMACDFVNALDSYILPMEESVDSRFFHARVIETGFNYLRVSFEHQCFQHRICSTARQGDFVAQRSCGQALAQVMLCRYTHIR